MTEEQQHHLERLKKVDAYWSLCERDLAMLTYLTQLKILEEIEAIKSRLPEPNTQSTP